VTSDRIPKVGAAGYGGMIGFCNTVFIACGVGLYWHGGSMLALIVFLFGILPGLVTGVALGALAASMAERPVWLRRVALAGPAVGVLLGLAAFFEVTQVFLLAIIPTVVSALILERNTRARSVMPVARLK
jgi:hypothetical protein